MATAEPVAVVAAVAVAQQTAAGAAASVDGLEPFFAVEPVLETAQPRPVMPAQGPVLLPGVVAAAAVGTAGHEPVSAVPFAGTAAAVPSTAAKSQNAEAGEEGLEALGWVHDVAEQGLGLFHDMLLV